VQKAVCFVSVADRGLRPKSRLQKAKTPARWLALSGSGTILPKKHYTLGLSFVNGKLEKSRVRPQRNGGGKFKDGDIMKMDVPSSFFVYMRVS